MVPDFQTFFRPVLELATAQEWRAPELVGAVADKLGLSEEDRKEPTAGGSKSRVEDRVRWSLTHLYRAGLLERPGRGRYVISERGRTLLAGFSGKITLEKLDEYPEYLAFRKSVGTNGEGNQRNDLNEAPPHAIAIKIDKKETPSERLQQAYIEMKAALAADLLDETRNISPATFEQLIVDLLLKMGFGGSKAEAGERLGKSGDGGVDGVIRQDALGLDVIYLQAKRYANDVVVSSSEVRSFAGALLARGASKGVFVTTSRFSPAAEKEAKEYKTHRITLLDGARLAALMIEHEVGVRLVQAIKLHRVDLSDYEGGDI